MGNVLSCCFSHSPEKRHSPAHNKTPSSRSLAQSIIPEIALCLVAHQCALPPSPVAAGVAPDAECVYIMQKFIAWIIVVGRVSLSICTTAYQSLSYLFISLCILHLCTSRERWRARACRALAALPSPSLLSDVFIEMEISPTNALFLSLSHESVYKWFRIIHQSAVNCIQGNCQRQNFAGELSKPQHQHSPRRWCVLIDL